MPETRLIAALAYPGVQLLDIIGPLETFNLASQQLLDDGDRQAPAYRVEVISDRAGEVVGMSGLSLGAHRGLDDDASVIDTLLLPGALTGDHSFFEEPRYLAWLSKNAPSIRRMCSVCSGAFLLARAGMLDGKRATTHWMDAAQLQSEFPAVRVEANQIFIEDDGIFTSGGITAGIDLPLALIERDHSRRLALKVAKRLLVFLKRPGDQLQFNSFLEAQVHPTPFESLLDWITEHLDEPLNTACLAKRCYLSERSFRRKFADSLGMSAREYLARARLTKAQSLLESTTLPLSSISLRCGFKSSAAMRYTFQKALGLTPSGYRQRFGNAPGG